ncbi:MAG: YfhO family protein [Cyanobacteria bacterium SZAS-4]|nr:YfhO family protein [Cyanobacteria bacterium SZAS-4]
MSDRLKQYIQPETWLPCLFLLVLLNVLFFPVLWGQKTLIHSSGDAPSIMPYGAYEQNKAIRQNQRSNDDGAPAWFSEPGYALLNIDYCKLAIPPLWNPYNGFGAPILANMQSQPFNPLILFACLSPSPKSDDLFVLARLLLAGILTHFYLKRFVGSYGSIFGATAFMLTGYFLIFINMPEIGVSAWMPGLFLGLELLAETISFNRVVLSGFFTAMILLGGMPEVAFLELFTGGIYFLARVLVCKSDWKIRNRFFLAYALSCAIGLAFAAPQILPFLEYIRESSNTHVGTIGAGGAAGPGSVIHQNFPAHFLNYLTPLIYGPLGDAKVKPGFGYDGFNGSWGVLAFAFALAAPVKALTSHFQKDLDKSVSRVVPVIYFFIGTLFILLGKTFGMPVVSLLGTLPLFKLVVFWKYSEPIIGFAIASLAGIGFDFVATGKLGKRWLTLSFVLATGILTSVALFDKRFIWGDHAVHMVFNKSLTIAIAFILVGFAVSYLALSKPSLRLKSCRLLLLLLCAELSMSFLLPTFYWFHQLAGKTADPYRGAPYISFLQSHLTEQDRVMGFDFVLMPNWSSAFQIRDIRNLDAMYPARYLAFVRNFCTDKEPTELADLNLTTRFHGFERVVDPLFSDADPTTLNRLWLLSSVRYFLATRNHFVGQPPEIIREVLSRAGDRDTHLLRLDAFTIDGQTKHVLFQHPTDATTPPNEVDYVCTVSNDNPFLNFSVAIDPRVRDITDGDGMIFSIHALSDKTDDKVFTKNVEPKRNDADRHWVPESVNLSKYAGKQIKLVFKVDPGVKQNTSGDWGGWADLQFSATKTSPAQAALSNPPKLAYDAEVQIYENAERLPRASMFYNFALAKTDEEALEQLKSEKFNPKSTVVLAADGLESAVLPKPIPEENLQAQTISKDSPLAIKIAVDAKHDGVFMLNDQYYPGWKVYVDGKEQAILRADYLFRGVLLKEGHHEVVFKYEPLSFHLGACLCAFATFTLSAFAFFIGRRKFPKLGGKT